MFFKYIETNLLKTIFDKCEDDKTNTHVIHQQKRKILRVRKVEFNLLERISSFSKYGLFLPKSCQTTN